MSKRKMKLRMDEEEIGDVEDDDEFEKHELIATYDTEPRRP